MSDQLFREVATPSVRVGSRAWTTIPLSIAAHAVILGGLVVVPLMATGVLPSPQSVMMYVAPPLIPPPPILPPPATTPPPSTAAPAAVPNPAVVPLVEPSRINPEPELPPSPTLLSTARGAPAPWSGVPGGTGRISVTAPPPPPVTRPLPVGGNIKEPSKIRPVAPVYPAIAQSAKISGIVIIEATIGRDGTVIETRVLRSVPLLDKAAVDAVRQWRFTPTLLNGVPVPIVMTVTVNFELR
jgi:protein TonB